MCLFFEYVSLTSGLLPLSISLTRQQPTPKPNHSSSGLAGSKGKSKWTANVDPEPTHQPGTRTIYNRHQQLEEEIRQLEKEVRELSHEGPPQHALSISGHSSRSGSRDRRSAPNTSDVEFDEFGSFTSLDSR